MKKILLTLLFSTMIFSAGAEKIIFDNAPTGYKEADISGTATIDASTGDITVTADNHWIVGEQNGYVSLYPSTYQTTANSNITLSWSVGFVSSCSTNGWSGSPAVTNGVHTTTVNVGTLPTTYNISCTDLLGNTVSASVTITETSSSGGGTTAPTLTLSASPTTHSSAPGTSTLTWTVSSATACTASGDWSGSKNINGGSEQVTMSSAGSYSYTLACSNSAGTTTRTAYVTVGSSTTNCTGNQAPPTGKTLKSLGTLASLTSTTSGNNPLVNPGSGRVGFELTQEQYAAIAFTAPSSSDGKITGNLAFENPPANQTTPASYRVTVSQCPGDFSTNSIPQNIGCGKQGGTTSLYWSIDPSAPATKCKLTSGETYYLNVINSSDAPDYGVSSCPGAKCGVLFGIN